MEEKDICKWYHVCPMKRYLEEGKLDIKWVNEYCWSNYQHCIRRKMEEKGEYHPDNMLPDGTIDEKLNL